MPIVVADTGPINYLILIGHIEVLPGLFEQVVMPSVVQDELLALGAPSAVRTWTANAPAWLDVRQISPMNDPSLAELGAGEKTAIILALDCHADLLLMDDRRGVKVAVDRGFKVAVTLGILAMGRQTQSPRPRDCV